MKSKKISFLSLVIVLSLLFIFLQIASFADWFCCTNTGCGVECCVSNSCSSGGCAWGPGFGMCFCEGVESTVECQL